MKDEGLKNLFSLLARDISQAQDSFSNETFDTEECQETFIVSVTGVPGVGKSTLVDQIASSIAEELTSIVILSFDPSSAISGGALLADRNSYTSCSATPNIFIRSLSARGHLGGTSQSIGSILRAISRFSIPLAIVETTGVGQSEIEVREISHGVIQVLHPDLGDEVHDLKSGIHEITDFFFFNNRSKEPLEIQQKRAHLMQIQYPDKVVVTGNARLGYGIDEIKDFIMKRLLERNART